MVFVPGSAPGPGRSKGSKTKLTKSVKEMVALALDELGGIDYLVQQGIRNPGVFLRLVGKLIPTQHTGLDDAPIKVSKVVRVVVDAKPGTDTRAIRSAVIDHIGGLGPEMELNDDASTRDPARLPTIN